MRLVVLFLLVAGCGGGGGSSAPAPEAAAVIGPAGGTLRVTSGVLAGAELFVPPGAVARDEEFEIWRAADLALAGLGPAGPAARFRPARAFAVPVTVTLPFTGPLAGPRVVHDDFGPLVLPVATIDSDRRTATVTVHSFSTLQVMRPNAAGEPAGDRTGTWIVSDGATFQVADLAQDGNEFSITLDGETLVGVVDGPRYLIVTDDGGPRFETIAFELGAERGDGTRAWIASDGTGPPSERTRLEFERQVGPLYDVTGTWHVEFTDNRATPPEAADADSERDIVLTQDDVVFTFETHAGTVTRDRYYVTWDAEEREFWLVFTLTPFGGDGTLVWLRADGASGAASVALFRLP
jgi:hypothetical protein